MDIGTGAGLAGATGVRPYLPPLLAGALARSDTGIDFDGTDWSFLESPVFLAVVLGLGVAAYLIERRDAGPQASELGEVPWSCSPASSASCSARCCSRARSRTGVRRAGSASCSGRCARRSAGSRSAASSSGRGAGSRAAPLRS